MWQLHEVTSTRMCILPGQRCNLQQVQEGWILEAKMPWRFSKKPPKKPPKKGKGRGHKIDNVGTDEYHLDEVNIVSVSQYHQSELLAKHKGDPEHIQISGTCIDAMTEAFATVQMPAEIGPNQQATLRCKVNTSASGNVMPLHAFSKLFPRHVTTDRTPTGLRPTRTRLTAYNESTIKQYGTLDTTINWKPEGKNVMNRLHTQWYIADTPGPAILGLTSCSKLGIVELNCAVSFHWKKPTQQKPTTECQQVQKDLVYLQPLNTKEDLIKAYPDRYEGIGHFPGIPHHSLERCQTCCPYTTKVPNCYVATGV